MTMPLSPVPPPDLRAVSAWIKLKFFVQRLREWILFPILLVVLFVVGRDVHLETRYFANAVIKEYWVTSGEVAPLQKILVKQGQEVQKNQVIALLNPILFELELKEVTKEKDNILALMEKEKRDFFLSFHNLLSRLLAQHYQAKESLLTTNASLKVWKKESISLQKEFQWLKGMQQNQLGRSTRLGFLEAQIQVLQQKMREYPSLARFYRTNAFEFLKMKRLFSQFKKELEKKKSLEQSFLVQLEIQKIRIQKLQTKLEFLKLKAPVSGVIHQVLRRTGEHVQVGEKLFSIVPSPTSLVLAYLPESNAKWITKGQWADVVPVFTSKNRRKFKYKAIVTGLGVLSPAPLRFALIPQKPQWLRPVWLQVQGPSLLIAGERLQVFFNDAKELNPAKSKVVR